jgi:hypothetical protein
MSIGVGDGITLPKITKCADIKRRKKNRHIAHRHRGVFYVVIGERIKNKKRLKQCRRSWMFIPDPGSKFFHPGSRVRLSGSRIQSQKDSGSRNKSQKDSGSWIWIPIKEFKYFEPKKLFLSSQKNDSACSSRIRILIIYPSRIRGSKRHLIPDSDSQHWFQVAQPTGHFEHVET